MIRGLVSGWLSSINMDAQQISGTLGSCRFELVRAAPNGPYEGAWGCPLSEEDRYAGRRLKRIDIGPDFAELPPTQQAAVILIALSVRDAR